MKRMALILAAAFILAPFPGRAEAAKPVLEVILMVITPVSQ